MVIGLSRICVDPILSSIVIVMMIPEWLNTRCSVQPHMIVSTTVEVISISMWRIYSTHTTIDSTWPSWICGPSSFII